MIVEDEEIRLHRDLPTGAAIDFEQRKSGYRAYHYTYPDGQRVRLPSVTTVLGRVLAKPELFDWYERMGAEAALRLERDGYLKHIKVEHVLEAIREARMGARPMSHEAMQRGKRLHRFMQTYLETGTVLSPSEFAQSERGYHKGATRWLMKADPQPSAVEQLVADPDDGFAGRFDMRGIVYGHDTIGDFKSNEKARIYPENGVQLAGYHSGDVACGSPPPDKLMVVAIGADGQFTEAYVGAGAILAWAFAVKFYRALAKMDALQIISAEVMA